MILSIGSLFAGIGGFDLAAERCGLRVAWQVEMDTFCRRVLAKHWPDVPRFGDIRELTGVELEPVDIVCGGFPCQPVSCAGQRLGQDDPRWLWPEMLRVVEGVRPRWVVAENVPGILGLGLDQVLSGLEGAGYEAAAVGIPAVAVGAPQFRQRLWIVAHAERPERRPRQPGGDDADRADAERPQAAGGVGASGANDRARHLAHADSAGLALGQGIGSDDGAERPPALGGGWWAVEPGMGRVAHGVPARVDRLRSLGNAIVPQVAEVIFGWILRASR